METVNGCEIRVVALMRSGQHAVIQWMANNCEGTRCLLNNVPLEGDIFRWQEKAISAYAGNSVAGLDVEKERAGDFSRKDYLIYNHESLDLRLFLEHELEAQHDVRFGKSRCRKDVLILRDPFNLFASSLKFYVRDGFKGIFPMVLRSRINFLWKQYAKEYLGLTCYLTHDKVVIRYNQWMSSPEERIIIAGKLGLAVKEDRVDFVPLFGGGSSFDQMDFNGAGSQMKTSERWKAFQDSDLYQGFFDEEMIALSEQIFGIIPGTEKLYPRKASFWMRRRQAAKSFQESWALYARGPGLFRRTISLLIRAIFLGVRRSLRFCFPALSSFLRRNRLLRRIFSGYVSRFYSYRDMYM